MQALQNPAAIATVMMKLSGETSNEVSSAGVEGSVERQRPQFMVGKDAHLTR